MYIGRVKPTETTGSVFRSTFTGDGSTTTFNLPSNVANEQAIIATINGVTQQDAAYTTNGSQIIFSAAPALNDAIELRVISNVAASYAPSTGSVTTGILADGAVTAGKLASGAAVANIGTRAIGVSQVPAGSVVQVVSNVYSTSTTTTSGSYVDTGLTASITPSSASSTILVLVNMSGMYINNSNNYARAMLVRNSTQLGEFLGASGYNTTSVGVGTGGMSYQDSPATTSSVTYKVQVLSITSGQTVYWSNNSSKCTLTLMEIAG